MHDRAPCYVPTSLSRHCLTAQQSEAQRGSPIMVMCIKVCTPCWLLHHAHVVSQCSCWPAMSGGAGMRICSTGSGICFCNLFPCVLCIPFNGATAASQHRLKVCAYPLALALAVADLQASAAQCWRVSAPSQGSRRATPWHRVQWFKDARTVPHVLH